ncbi:MAG: hypothetical protein GY701_28710 [Sulfitobacter sp.]|nr:hypothetical protein [Sulfitobacter sp.]
MTTHVNYSCDICGQRDDTNKETQVNDVSRWIDELHLVTDAHEIKHLCRDCFVALQIAFNSKINDLRGTGKTMDKTIPE